MSEMMNGGYVTRAELNAHLLPMRADIKDIRDDVKSLLAANAGSKALSSWQRFWAGTVGVGLLSAVATLVWLASSH